MQFELLEPHHFLTLKPFFERLPYTLSVFSLPSIMAWRDVDDFAVHFAVTDDDILLMTATNSEEPKYNHMALPLPADEVGPERLAALCRELGFRQLWYVPPEYVEQHGREALAEHFTVKSQDEYQDYVYRTDDLAELQGRKFAKKRNLIHQFEAAYVDAGRVAVEPIGPPVLEECLTFVDEWCLERDCDGEDKPMMACEKSATLNALEDFVALELSGILIRVDGKVSGLGVRAPLTPNMGVLHFEKAFSEHKGLYQFLDRECARQLFQGHDEFLNKESDMGMDGLRQAKRSYHPAFMVGCYQLELR